jgi:hypothetical protein
MRSALYVVAQRHQTSLLDATARAVAYGLAVNYPQLVLVEDARYREDADFRARVDHMPHREDEEPGFDEAAAAEIGSLELPTEDTEDEQAMAPEAVRPPVFGDPIGWAKDALIAVREKLLVVRQHYKEAEQEILQDIHMTEAHRREQLRVLHELRQQNGDHIEALTHDIEAMEESDEDRGG